MILTQNCNTITIQQAINRLFAKRGITWYRTELYLINSNEQVKNTSFIYRYYYIVQVLVMSLSMCKVEMTKKEILIRVHCIFRMLLELKC